MAIAERDIQPDQTDSPESVAADALRRADGDWKRASMIMHDRIKQDRALRDVVLEPFMRSAIWYFIRRSAHKKRQSFHVGGRTTGSDNASGIDHVSKRNWYEYPLPGGLPLGDATREDLQEAVDHHVQLSESNARKARWLERVLHAMPKRSRKAVREKLSLDQLDALAGEEA